MNTKRFLLASIVAFIFVFIYEFAFHGMLLKGLYEQTAHLWRLEGEHKMQFILLSQLGFALMMGFIFTLKYEGKGIGEGVRFGLLMGLLVGAIELGTYCYMPIPLALTLAWVAGAILKGVGTGIVLSLVYRK